MKLKPIEDQSNKVSQFQNKYETSIAFIAVMICVVMNPFAHYSGRFWAEEGTYFFSDLYGKSFVDSIFYVYKGTVQITTNMAVYLSANVPIRFSPLVTSWIGTAFIASFAFSYAIWAKSLKIEWPFCAIAIGTLLISGQFYEILSNSTNLQWICSLLVLLFAFFPAASVSKHFVIYALVVLLSGLSGVPSNTLAPLMFAKAWVDRSLEKALLAIILSFTTLVQIITIFGSSLSDRDLSRYSLFELIYMSIVKPGLGIILTQKGSQVIMTPLYENFSDVSLFSLSIILLAFYMYAIYRSKFDTSAKVDLILLIITASYVSVINVAGSLSSEVNAMTGVGGGRYFLIGHLSALMSLCIIIVQSQAPLSWFGRAILGLGIGLNAGYAIATNMTNRYAVHGSWQAQVDGCQRARVGICDVVIWPGNLGQEWVVQLKTGQVLENNSAGKSSDRSIPYGSIRSAPADSGSANGP